MLATSTPVIVQLATSNDGLYVLLSGILGAGIGAVSAYFVTRLQLNKARDLDIDRRLFDARRAAYERALSVLSFTHNERLNDRSYPKNSLDVNAQWKTHDMLGPVVLWSNKELVNKIFELSSYFAHPIPTNPAKKTKDVAKGIQLWKEVVLLMRSEVGTGDFLKESIGELPERVGI